MNKLSAATEKALKALQEGKVEIVRHEPLNNEAYTMIEVLFVNKEGLAIGTVINATGASRITNGECIQHGIRALICQFGDALAFYDIF